MIPYTDDEAREAALQFHLDHWTEPGSALAVDIRDRSVREVRTAELYKLAPRRRRSGRTMVVLLLCGETLVGTTSMARRPFTLPERLRFAMSTADGHQRFARASLPDEPHRRAWIWIALRGNHANATSHQVDDADLAHDREADVRAAVAAGRVPVLVSIGKKRAAHFAVLP